MKFDNQNDARRVFEGSIIRIKQTPVYVQGVTEGMKLICFNIEDGKRRVVDVNSDNINIKPVPVGMVNGFGSVVYAMRSTPRVYQQGLSRDNIKVHLFTGSRGEGQLQRDVQNLTSIHLSNTIRNIYPSLEEAIEQINDGCEMCAFSRHLALGQGFSVFHKTTHIGSLNPKNSVISLLDNCKHYSFILEPSYACN